jgi:hypothetical protein
MSVQIATGATGNPPTGAFGRELVGSLPEMVRYGEVRIGAYTPFLPAANAWLSMVEERIRASIRPEDAEQSTEWLNIPAAAEAISFFQRVADLLPTEPHLSATHSGDLVAEFDAPACSMTSVVSDKETILFGVSDTDPDKPVLVVIRRGSNRLREELKEFTRRLRSVSHGTAMAHR